MEYYLEASCACHTGRVRKNNEDNFYFNGQILAQEHSSVSKPIYKRFDQEAVCFAVFDGMGGEADGQIASHLAAQTFRKDCEQMERGGMMSESLLNNAVTHMNDAVVLNAQQSNNHMGTTAAIVGFCVESVYVGNVGDSRIYRLRQKQFSQISMDHTEKIPPFMQKTRHQKPRLSQCIGISPKELLLEPYLAKGKVKAGDIFVISSDGMTDMLSEKEILDVLHSGRDAGVCVQELIEKSLQNGGRDNITVIVIRVIQKPMER